jgi:hypothetical protein
MHSVLGTEHYWILLALVNAQDLFFGQLRKGVFSTSIASAMIDLVLIVLNGCRPVEVMRVAAGRIAAAVCGLSIFWVLLGERS